MAKQANKLLDSVNKGITSRDKEDIFHSAQHLSGHTWNSVFSFGLCYTKKRYGQAGKGPERAFNDERTGKPGM